MKHLIPTAFAFGLLVSGSVLAQTAAPATSEPSTSTTGSTPPTGSTAATPPTGSTAANPPSSGPSTSPSPAAVATTSEPTRTTEAPVAGANSFTEGQARARIEERGFAQVTDLKKDDQGIWRGTAMKDGKSVAVALDYQGNIVGQ